MFCPVIFLAMLFMSPHIGKMLFVGIKPAGLSFGMGSATLSSYLLNFNLILLNIKEAQASLVAQMVKNLPAVQETQVRSLGQEDPLEKERATHSSILAWRIPWKWS